MPVIAAFTAAALGAIAEKSGLADSGLHAMVVFAGGFLARRRPDDRGARAGGRTDGVRVEPTRLRGDAACVARVRHTRWHRRRRHTRRRRCSRATAEAIGDWAPWVGVLVFAVGVTVANSHRRSRWVACSSSSTRRGAAKCWGNALLGGYVSAFIGAVVMTIVAVMVSRLPSAMPAHALFIPGFWLLVPGALGLIGLTQLAGDVRAAGPRTS